MEHRTFARRVPLAAFGVIPLFAAFTQNASAQSAPGEPTTANAAAPPATAATTASGDSQAPPAPPSPGQSTLPLGSASPPPPPPVISSLASSQTDGSLGPGPLSAIRIEPESPKFPAEVWSDNDYNSRRRIAFGDFGVSLNAEYRANLLYIRPISLNSYTNRNAHWIEHRMRLDLSADYLDKVRIILSADMFDGVLWGDNGDFGATPSSNAGVSASARNPNVTRPCVAVPEDGDPLDPDSYGYTLCEQDPIRLRKLYTQISTPVGTFRIGRQPIIAGAGVQANDGEGRTNRFGFARTGNMVDRILFATKPLEAFKPKEKRNTSETEGLILALGYDRIVTDSPQLFADDASQWFTALIFSQPEHPLGKNLLATAFHVHRWNPQNASSINVVGMRANNTFPGGISAGFDVAYNFGSTREVSEAYKFITNDPVVDQQIQQFGARAVLRYDNSWLTAYMEFDYASGDPDPNVTTPLSQFVFAEDTNVGLLLFEHALAFQTARASAAGVETLRRLGAKSYPAEVVNTRGSFTNAIALFPQVDVRPVKGLQLRAGALFAWAESDVVDPVATLQLRDGLKIEDDAVNFVGAPATGKRYYGTELDARISYRLLDHVNFELEGAVLFPGDALQNRQGEAAQSVLIQGRTTAFF
ncbi:MAG: alginate export family protein [Polyangiaceae bacterium]|nr:alginate export family protein [Polyangiaceae bacterium]